MIILVSSNTAVNLICSNSVCLIRNKVRSIFLGCDELLYALAKTCLTYGLG